MFEIPVNKTTPTTYVKESLKIFIECNFANAKSAELNKRPFQFCNHYLSLVVRKPAFCICENKDGDQLRGNSEADQRLCFRYTDSTIHLLPKSEISRL